MWFASVWIFTLRLPWQLGAAFMYRHLLDGDPASNTLSWRWVGGLHTAGKIYVARPDNIATFSDGRWAPDSSDLALHPEPLPFDGPHPIHPLMLVSDAPIPQGSLALLHDEYLSADLSPEFAAQGLHFAIMELCRSAQSEKVRAHVSLLRRDAASRTNAHILHSAEDVAALAQQYNSATIHTMLPPIGFEQSELFSLSTSLENLGVTTIWHRTSWDTRFMPRAQSGFFKFWEGVRGSFI